MTVYVLPCGVSVLRGLAGSEGKPADAKTSRLIAGAADLGRGVLAHDDGDVIRWWAEYAARYTADARLARWEPRALSAETNSLAASSRLGRLRGLLDRDDRVVLLASDTASGVAAALCVAQHVAGPKMPDAAYVSTPETLTDSPWRPELTGGMLTIVRLRGLDPRHAGGGFTDAVAGIGQALRASFDVGEPLEVHLTGGFKATLLHTLAMTEVLYSLAPGRVTACYMFEDTDRPDATTTPIGLRRFDQAMCDDMRAELAGIRDGRRHPGARTFEGLAWTGRGLNAFGYGYLAVLGERLTHGRPGPTG
jgi:hypothetical protein